MYLTLLMRTSPSLWTARTRCCVCLFDETNQQLTVQNLRAKLALLRQLSLVNGKYYLQLHA